VDVSNLSGGNAMVPPRGAAAIRRDTRPDATVALKTQGIGGSGLPAVLPLATAAHMAIEKWQYGLKG
jgi:hypothetical protein